MFDGCFPAPSESIGTVKTPQSLVSQAFAAFCHSNWPFPNSHGFPKYIRHYVQFYPILFDKSIIPKQNRFHRSNIVCDGSPSRMRMVRRISLGITTRPRSSMRRTIPVAFMVFLLRCAAASRGICLYRSNNIIRRIWKGIQIQPLVFSGSAPVKQALPAPGVFSAAAASDGSAARIYKCKMIHIR